MPSAPRGVPGPRLRVDDRGLARLLAGLGYFGVRDRDAFVQAAGAELSCGVAGLGFGLSGCFPPFPARRVGHPQPGHLLAAHLGEDAGRARGLVSGFAGGLGFRDLAAVLPFGRGQFGADVRWRGCLGLAVPVDPHLMLAAPHGPQQRVVVRQLQRADGRVERFPELGLVRGRWPDRLLRVGDPGCLAVGADDAGLLLPVRSPRRRFLPRRGSAPGLECPLRRPLGELAAEVGLALIQHALGLGDVLRGAPRCPLSPGSRLPPLRGRFFSQAAVKHRGDRPGAFQRPGCDRVQRVVDRSGRRSHASAAAAGTPGARGP